LPQKEGGREGRGAEEKDGRRVRVKVDVKVEAEVKLRSK
jgi:hypothetical protein